MDISEVLTLLLVVFSALSYIDNRNNTSSGAIYFNPNPNNPNLYHTALYIHPC